MPYFLEYATGNGTGRFVVGGTDSSGVLAKANEAVQGLDCIRARILWCPEPVSVFGAGSLRATYTPKVGWTVHPEETC